jgi:hypothetical protein
MKMHSITMHNVRYLNIRKHIHIGEKYVYFSTKKPELSG